MIVQELVKYRSLFTPIGLCLGIVGYYQLPFEPTYGRMLFVLPGLYALFLLHKQVGWFAMVIFAGFLAFKLRVDLQDTQFLNFRATKIFKGLVLENRIKTEESKHPFQIILSELHDMNPCYGPIMGRLPRKLLLSSDKAFQPGQIIMGCMKIRPVGLPVTPDGYDPRFYAFFQGIEGQGEILPDVENVSHQTLGLISRVRNFYISRLQDLMGKDSDVVRAMLFGDKGGLKKDVVQAFSSTGLSHALAISGLHISILAGICVLLGKVLFVRAVSNFGVVGLLNMLTPLTFGKIMAAVAVCCYVMLSGASFSALRASFMFLIGLLVFAFQRNTSFLFILSTAVSVMLMIFPESLFFASFQLSVIAILGFCIMPRFSERTLRDKVIAGLFVTLIISLITLPLIIFHFQEVSIQPFAANLLCMPFISLILIPSSFLLLILPFKIVSYFVLWQVWFLKWFVLKLAFFAPTIKILKLPAYSVFIYAVTLPFFRTKLRAVSLVGMGFVLLGFILPGSKPLLITDQYGKIGFVKNNVLYVSFVPNEQFVLERWKEYFVVQAVRQFNAPESEFMIGGCAKKTCNASWKIDDIHFAWLRASQNIAHQVDFGFGPKPFGKHTFHPADLFTNGGVVIYKDGSVVRYQYPKDRLWWKKVW